MVVADSSSPHAPAGHALVVCMPASLDALTNDLAALGFEVHGIDNPFAAIVELLDRPLVYRSVILSLPALYREELNLIKTIRSRLPHIDVLLAHTDGRAAAMAEAMRLGATGLLDDEAVHRLSDIDPPPSKEVAIPSRPTLMSPSIETSTNPPIESPTSTTFDDDCDIEPILTADELRALLQEQPTLPPNG